MHLILVVDVAKLFFDSASDLAKQLITVSTGILALSITFLKDVVKVNPEINFGALKWSWGLYIASIFFGFWTLMAITGSIWNLLEANVSSQQVVHIQAPAFLQIVLFFFATIFLICYGLSALRKLAEKPEPPPIRKGSVD